MVIPYPRTCNTRSGSSLITIGYVGLWHYPDRAQVVGSPEARRHTASLPAAERKSLLLVCPIAPLSSLELIRETEVNLTAVIHRGELGMHVGRCGFRHLVAPGSAPVSRTTASM